MYGIYGSCCLAGKVKLTVNIRSALVAEMSDSAQPAELPQYIAQLVESFLEHRVLCLALYE